jgi:hypothetical protein
MLVLVFYLSVFLEQVKCESPTIGFDFPHGVPAMRHPTVFLALMTTGLILGCVMVCLAVISNERDLCRNSFSEPGLCRMNACRIARTPVFATENQPSPTLAPPRSDTANQNAEISQDSEKGQPVFLHVETDRNEIEVGWAAP